MPDFRQLLSFGVFWRRLTFLNDKNALTYVSKRLFSSIIVIFHFRTSTYVFFFVFLMRKDARKQKITKLDEKRLFKNMRLRIFII